MGPRPILREPSGDELARLAALVAILVAVLAWIVSSCSWRDAGRFLAPDELTLERGDGAFEGPVTYEDETWSVAVTWYLMPREVRDVSDTKRSWYEAQRVEIETGRAVVEEKKQELDARESEVAKKEAIVGERRKFYEDWRVQVAGAATAVGAVIAGVVTKKRGSAETEVA